MPGDGWRNLINPMPGRDGDLKASNRPASSSRCLAITANRPKGGEIATDGQWNAKDPAADEQVYQDQGTDPD